MKKPLLLLIVSMLATSVQAESFFFKPKGWTLGTVFPDKPKQTETRTPKPEGDIVESRATYETTTGALALTRIHNPVPILEGRIPAAYDGAKNGVLRSMNATLISEKAIEIAGHEARRYVISANDGEITCEMHMVIIGDDLFIFMHLRPRLEPSTVDSIAFFGKISDAPRD